MTRALRCSEGQIKDIAEKFASNVELVSTTDGFLIKLGTLVLELKKECGDASIALRLVLSEPRVLAKLEKFRDKKDEIYMLIELSPRFRDLREYGIIILEALSKPAATTSWEEEEIIQDTYCIEQRYLSALEERLLESLHGVKTLDTMLIRLSSLVSLIKDDCGSDRQVAYVLRKLLLRPMVAYALKPLYVEKDIASDIVDTDPRFKNLRPYFDLIIYSIGEGMRQRCCIKRGERLGDSGWGRWGYLVGIAAIFLTVALAFYLLLL